MGCRDSEGPGHESADHGPWPHHRAAWTEGEGGKEAELTVAAAGCQGWVRTGLCLLSFRATSNSRDRPQ